MNVAHLKAKRPNILIMIRKIGNEMLAVGNVGAWRISRTLRCTIIAIINCDT